jgi:LmbE family N-acetylglucosaminyl deacetylase
VTARAAAAALATAALVLLAAAAPAAAAPREATRGELRAIRAALRPDCLVTERFVQVAVSRRDPRVAIFAFDDRRRATTLCTAIVRRPSRRAARWRVQERREGLRVIDRAVLPCPARLPRDLRGTVRPPGAPEPQVYCGN